MSAQNKWRKMRKGTIACIALAASVSMVAGAGAAGAQANMASANPLASMAASLDPQTKTVLGDVMAQAMDPMLGALRNSTSQVGVDTVDTEAGEETSVTWRVDTGSLAESLGGEVSTDKELAMIAMPRGVVSSGDVTVTRVSVDDSGQEIRTEIPVSDMGSVEEGVRGAVLGPVATVHEMTSPEAVTIYGHILRELARGGTLESLAPLAGDLAAAAGVEVPEVVDPAAMTRGQAEAMVPQLMAMQNVLTGENPLDVLLGDTSVPTVEHANLMVDVAPGDVLEIKTTGDAKIVDQKVTALLPHSMIAGANSMINAAATQASNEAGAATAPQLPQLPVIPGLPQVSDLQALLTPSSNKTANAVAGSVGAPDEFVFQTYSGPVGGTGFVQTQLPTGALDPSMFMDILGPLLSADTLDSVFGALEGVLGNEAALGDIFGAISGEGGDIAPGQLATSLLTVISELATGIIPALSEAITERDPSKLTDFINEVISQGGLDTEIPGITDTDGTGTNTTGGTGTDGTGTDTTGGGTGTGTDGTGTEASDDIGDKISVNEAFEIYDLVATKIDERGSSTGSTSQNKQVSDTTTRGDSDGTDPDPEGASSPDRSETSESSYDDYGSSDYSSQESANYNTAAQESLPVTGASAYTAYYAAGGLLLLVVSAAAYFGGFGRIKNWVGRSK